MSFHRLAIPEVVLIKPDIFNDKRGFFYESFNSKLFNDFIGSNINFVQDNISFSSKGVVRGLHAQRSPYAQGKLVQVLNGEIFDVAVDIRADSPTFNKWVGVKLCSTEKNQLWIPEGFAHGFMALSEDVLFHYKVTNFYSKKDEIYFNWKSNEFNIQWPELDEKITTSFKDSL